MLIKTKRFWVFLIVFGKYFIFAKCQKFQKLYNPVLATWLRVHPVTCPQSWAYSVGFRNSLAGQSPSREKDLENFSKIFGFRFLATLFGNLFVSGSFSRELTQKFSWLPSWLPREWNFQSQKILRQVFQIFLSQSVCWLGLVAKNACFAL